MALANNFVEDADNYNSIKVEVQTETCDYENTFLTRAPSSSPAIISTTMKARDDDEGDAVTATAIGVCASNEASSVSISHAVVSAGSGLGHDQDRDVGGPHQSM
jgi:hypothetical protein